MKFKFLNVLTVLVLVILMSLTAFGAETVVDERSIWQLLLVVLGGSSLVAGIVCFIFYSQMKSAHKQSAAKEYVVDDSVEIFGREDSFSHTTETRRKA